MELLDLLDAYMLSRRNSRRSTDQVEMEVALHSRLYDLWERVNQWAYEQLHGYSFIHRRGARPREVFAPEVEMKILQCYFDKKMRPLVEAELCDRTFNNRVGYGGHAAINRLIEDMDEASEGYSKEAWVIKWDLKGFFPNVSQDRSYKLAEDIINKNFKGREREDLIQCARVSCFCTPTIANTARRSPPWEWLDIPDYKSLFKKPCGTGGAIGYLFWQIVTNLYLSGIDKWVMANMSKRYVRFVDDSVIVVTAEEKPLALSMFEELRKEYAKIGVAMHPDKFYCQKVTHGIEFLGYHIRPNRLHANDKVYHRAIKAAKRRCGIRRYVSSVNSYLGMIKAGTDRKRCADVLDRCKRKGITKDYENYKILIDKSYGNKRKHHPSPGGADGSL